MKVTLTKAERRFLEANEMARIATSSAKGWPLVTPVNYMLLGDSFYIATDYDTTKYRHLKENPRASLVVDTLVPNKAVIIQGKAELIEGGPEFEEVYSAFYKRFEWVRRDPWKAGEAPFIKISPIMKSGWV